MPENKKNRRQMTAQEIEAVRQGLIERKKDLWSQVMHQLEHEAGERHRSVLEVIRESGDRALEELFESNLLSLVELKARELEDIEAALIRIERGEYGVCTDCGQWIRPARLEVMPYSIRCRKCQEQHEKLVQA